MSEINKKVTNASQKGSRCGRDSIQRILVGKLNYGHGFSFTTSGIEVTPRSYEQWLCR